MDFVEQNRENELILNKLQKGTTESYLMVRPSTVGDIVVGGKRHSGPAARSAMPAKFALGYCYSCTYALQTV